MCMITLRRQTQQAACFADTGCLHACSVDYRCWSRVDLQRPHSTSAATQLESSVVARQKETLRPVAGNAGQGYWSASPFGTSDATGIPYCLVTQRLVFVQQPPTALQLLIQAHTIVAFTSWHLLCCHCASNPLCRSMDSFSTLVCAVCAFLSGHSPQHWSTRVA